MRAKKIMVKDKDGVIHAAELGGGGGLPPELKEIQINGESAYVKRSDRKLTWAQVEALKPNTGIAPTAEEKEVYRDRDGGYTLERTVYEAYISQDDASNGLPPMVTAIAADETSKVTLYGPIYPDSDEDATVPITYWGKITDFHSSEIEYMMTNDSVLSFIFGPVRDGMDDMKAALSTQERLTAQQRVYIDVEGADGGKSYYVLVIHNSRNYNRNVGRYKFPAGYPVINGAGECGRSMKYAQDSLFEEEVNGRFKFYAIWVYPADTDLKTVQPNGEPILWSDEADQSKLTATQKATVEEYGTVDEFGRPYPLAFKARVPFCDCLMIKMLTENPLSAIGYSKVFSIGNYTEGGIVDVYDDFVPTPGQELHLYGAVRTQQELIDGSTNAKQRRFDLYVEFYVPESMKAALKALGLMAQEETT